MTGWAISVTEAVAGLNWNFVANIIISKGFPSRHPFFSSSRTNICKFQLDLAGEPHKNKRRLCDFLFKYCIRFSVLKNIVRINLTRYFETIFQLLVKTKNCISWFYFFVETSRQKIKCSFYRHSQ